MVFLIFIFILAIVLGLHGIGKYFILNKLLLVMICKKFVLGLHMIFHSITVFILLSLKYQLSFNLMIDVSKFNAL
jgi:hypothetical protein